VSRVENSSKNFITGLMNQFLILVFRFVTRTVFIKCLGEEFLGINGLFSNILSLLSLADLGIGTALIYSLYKPIADNDKERQNVIIHYLKRVYFVIGLVILSFSLILLPFIKFVINEDVTFINIYIVFLLYAFQTASTYLFFASYSEFLNANQKLYIYNKVANVITIISNIVQVVVLVTFKDFYIYLVTIILFGIIQSFIVALRTRREFPFIKEKPKNTLTKREKINIFKDCGSLMIYRTNYVILMATDNIVLSKYLGLAVVGIYSNYVLIVNSIVNVLQTFFFSIKASIGNLHASNEREKDHFIFKLVNILSVSFFGIFAIGVFCLVNDFITIWIGEKFLLPKVVVFILSINLYFEGVRQFLASYRSTYGLFRNAKFMPLFGAFSNVVLSIILVQYFGISGVLLGTIISNLISFLWYDPYIIYKKVFNSSPVKYYLRNIIYFIFFIVVGGICQFICNMIKISGILGFLVHGVICVIIPVMLLIIIYINTEYGVYFKEMVIRLLNRLRRRENG